jgi:hypothetical protein
VQLRQSGREQEQRHDSAHGARRDGNKVRRSGSPAPRGVGSDDLSQGGAELPKCSELKAPDTREGCEVADRVTCVVPPNTETGNN